MRFILWNKFCCLWKWLRICCDLQQTVTAKNRNFPIYLFDTMVHCYFVATSLNKSYSIVAWHSAFKVLKAVEKKILLNKLVNFEKPKNRNVFYLKPFPMDVAFENLTGSIPHSPARVTDKSRGPLEANFRGLKYWAKIFSRWRYRIVDKIYVKSN